MDDFIDKYSFIVDEATGEDLRQKNLNLIADSIGDIAESVIIHRETAGQSQIISRWIHMLREISTESFKLRRTSVAFSSIENIKQICSRCLINGNWKDASLYRAEIKRIGDICLQADTLYSAQILIKCLNAHFDLFREIFDLALKNEQFVSVNDISYLLDEYEDMFVEAKKNYSQTQFFPIQNEMKMAHRNLTYRLLLLGQANDPNPNKQHHLYEIFGEYIEFMHNLVHKNLKENDSDLFTVYAEMLLFISNRVDISDPQKRELISELTNYWTRTTRKRFKYGVGDRRTNELESADALSDYYAVLLWLYGNDEDMIGEALEGVASVYLDLFSQRPLTANQENERDDLYRQLKLYASWTRLYLDITSLDGSAYELLVTDVYTPDPHQGLSQQLMPFMGKYGYPVNQMATKPWVLKASVIYQSIPPLRDSLESMLNNTQNYKEFHEELISEHNKR